MTQNSPKYILKLSSWKLRYFSSRVE